MCGECHADRVVSDAAQGSHPVGVTIPAGAYKNPTGLPLDTDSNAVQCMSCHRLHGSPSDDGTLVRMADGNALCADCHTLADTATPAAHLDAASGALWPGPQYGSDFPAVTDSGKRGFCTNCHQPHGWPDTANPGEDFPALLVNAEENLCYACHDGSPAATNVLLQQTKSYRHPSGDFSGRHAAGEGGDSTSYGTANRHAECGDCHDPHLASADASPPAAPLASQRLAGVGRVAVTNGAAGSTPSYQYLPPSDPAPAREYELCFKCHSSWTTQPSLQTDLALKFNPNNQSFHPIEEQGKNLNIRPLSFVNGWTPTGTMYCTDCHTSDDPTVRGPHGSQYRYLLKGPFVASGGPRTTASTEACFDCHRFATYGTTQSSDTVLAYSRFNRPNFEEGHSFHVAEKRAPCWACHDSHGSANQPHLIVTGRNPGLNSYTETPSGGSCAPTCHSPRNYTLNYAR
jgi:predicted CXXCH cytochrome family protein